MWRFRRHVMLALRKPLMLEVRSALSVRARPLVIGMYCRGFCNGPTLRATPASAHEGRNDDESMTNEANESNDNEQKDHSNPRDPPKGQTVSDLLWKSSILGSAFLGAITFSALIKFWSYEAERAKMLNRSRKESFAIYAPRKPTYTLKRKEKEDCWKAFIYNCLLMNSGAITWIYGSKRVGKSTMLRADTFRLQTELRNGKVANSDKYEWLKRNNVSDFEVFYVNLEEKSGSAEQTEAYIRELRHQMLDNSKNGQMSLVVVDSIGAMFGQMHEWDEDTQFEDFRKTIDVPLWVSSFFRFVKAMTDDNCASFVFVTSSPMHLVLDLGEIKRYMIGNVYAIDIEKDEGWKSLSLDLTDQEISQMIKENLPHSTNGATVTEFTDALEKRLDEKRLQMKRIGHCLKEIESLLKLPHWQEKLDQFEEFDKQESKHRRF